MTMPTVSAASRNLEASLRRSRNIFVFSIPFIANTSISFDERD
jgi:hypothetical protein